MSKTEEMEICIKKIKEMLYELRPDNGWEICYGTPDMYDISDWKKEYLKLVDDEDYIFVMIKGETLYAINVTGTSVLYSMKELLNLLSEKF